ncbi:MAG: exodeoxyribonuclease VII large subunit [Deltaproteobacteria bacterium]
MKILEVSQVNRYIKELFSRDLLLNGIWIKGEISNFKHHSSGHMYFTLKDNTSTLKCVMFQTQAARLRFVPANGMKIIGFGRISVFERDGQYQLYCEELQPDGLGALYAAFEQLKLKLEKEGVFSAVNKKSIPFLSERVGVVTSQTGAVIKDIINVASRRFPGIQIVLFPVSVQGTTAAGEVANAIEDFNRTDSVDVIIVARGGGSLEDLWAFNEEIVARAIFNSRIPIISAVGHETDYTIADMVADFRAPTPSAAAEIAVPDRKELDFRIYSITKRLKNSLKNNVANARNRLDRVQNRAPFRQPFDKIYQIRMLLDINTKDLIKKITSEIQIEKKRLSNQLLRLGSLNPVSILARGYCVAEIPETDSIIKSVEGVSKNQEINIKFIDGKALCQVLDIEKEKLDS